MITCQNFLFSILAKLREYCCEQNEFITQMLDFLEHTVAIYFQAITSLVPWITMTKSQPMIDHQPLYQFHLDAVSDDQLMLNSSTFWTACSMKKCASHWDDMSVTGRLTVGPTDKFKMETADYTTTFLYLHRWAIGLRCSSREFTKA